MEHLGKGLIDSLIITMPIVLTAAGIGLVVGILQAVTQVQEQTIAAAPKIVGVFLVILIMGGFFTKMLTEYLTESVDLALKVIPKQDDYILPALESHESVFDPKKFMSGKKADFNGLMNTPGKVPLEDHKFKQSTIKTTPSSGTTPNLVETKKIYGK